MISEHNPFCTFVKNNLPWEELLNLEKHVK